jgi:hypothetical protein
MSLRRAAEIPSNRCGQFAFGRLVRNRTLRRRRAIGLLQFDFLGNRGDGVAYPVDDGLQRLDGYAKPFGPGPNLGRIGEFDFIADRWMFGALHGGIPCLQINGTRTASFHFARMCLSNEKSRPKAALSLQASLAKIN